jgi:formate/nitrite transporter FocA (FNT family)
MRYPLWYKTHQHILQKMCNILSCSYSQNCHGTSILYYHFSWFKLEAQNDDKQTEIHITENYKDDQHVPHQIDK